MQTLANMIQVITLTSTLARPIDNAIALATIVSLTTTSISDCWGPPTRRVASISEASEAYQTSN